jgi:hypothetical protein
VIGARCGCGDWSVGQTSGRRACQRATCLYRQLRFGSQSTSCRHGRDRSASLFTPVAMVIAQAILATPDGDRPCIAPALRCGWTMVTCCARTAHRERGPGLSYWFPARWWWSWCECNRGYCRNHDDRTDFCDGATEWGEKGCEELAPPDRVTFPRSHAALILILPSVTVAAFLLAGWSTRGRSYPRAYSSRNGRYRKQRACGPAEVHADSIERQRQLCPAS